MEQLTRKDFAKVAVGVIALCIALCVLYAFWHSAEPRTAKESAITIDVDEAAQVIMVTYDKQIAHDQGITPEQPGYQLNLETAAKQWLQVHREYSIQSSTEGEGYMLYHYEVNS